MTFTNALDKMFKNATPIQEMVDYGISCGLTEEEAKQRIANKQRARAQSQAIGAGEDEKKEQFAKLDELFLDQYHPHIVLMCRGEYREFYEYRTGVYVAVTKREMEEKVDVLMRATGLDKERINNRKIKDTVSRISNRLASIPDRVFTEGATSQKSYINLRNGLLDPATLQLIPHTPAYFSTAQLPFDYDPAAVCPQFEAFVARVSGGDMDNGAMLQEMFGYCLLNGNPKHKIFCLHGSTARNGKSTTAKILMGLVGQNNCATYSLEQIAADSTSIFTGLVGKHLNFSDEVSSKYVESPRLISLAAEGHITINPKYEAPYHYQVRSKFLIACNDMPRFQNVQGMQARMIVIPFPVQIPEAEREANLDARLIRKEGAGILNWALAGLKRLSDNNSIFTASEESREIMQENKMGSNSVFAYLADTFEASGAADPLVKHSSEDLYGKPRVTGTDPTQYHAYCEETGVKAVSLRNFQSELQRLASDPAHPLQYKRTGKERYYYGIKIKPSF